MILKILQIYCGISFARITVLLGQGDLSEEKREFSTCSGPFIYVAWTKLAIAVVSTSQARTSWLHAWNEGCFSMPLVLYAQGRGIRDESTHQ